MVLCCSKKTISIIEGNNVETQWWLLLFKFFSFVHNKFESHKNVCENKDFCNVVMPFEETKILEFNQRQKSDEAPFAI